MKKSHEIVRKEKFEKNKIEPENLINPVGNKTHRETLNSVVHIHGMLLKTCK